MKKEELSSALYGCIAKTRILRILMAMAAPMFIVCIAVMLLSAAIFSGALTILAELAGCFFAVLAFAGGEYRTLGRGFLIMALLHFIKFAFDIADFEFTAECFSSAVIQAICIAVYLKLVALLHCPADEECTK